MEKRKITARRYKSASPCQSSQTSSSSQGVLVERNSPHDSQENFDKRQET